MAVKRTFSPIFKTASPKNCATVQKDIIPASSISFNSESVIGQGATSRVYIGKYNGHHVAVKQFIVDNPKLPSNKNLLLKEAAQLMDLKHDHIIHCHGVCIEHSSLILELAQKSIVLNEESIDVHSLRHLIDAVQEQFPLSLKKEALLHIASGIEYLHKRNLYHGDLKSDNVLVTGNAEEFIFKLCDVGHAHYTLRSKLVSNMSVSASNSRMKPGTMSFEAPEVLIQGIKNSASDIYSFSMIMYELLHPLSSHPWESTFQSHGCFPQMLSTRITEAVKGGKRPVIENGEVSTKYVNLMIECWSQEPDRRPSASALKPKIESLQDEENETVEANLEPSDEFFSPLKINPPARQSTSRKRLFCELTDNNELTPPEPPNDFNRSSTSMAHDGFMDLNNNMSDLEKDIEEQMRNYSDEEHEDSEHPPQSLLMTWAGYAGTRLKLALSAFQNTALFAFHRQRDALVLQATGSGKSLCFQMQAIMMQPGNYGLLIVPTIALGEDHLTALESMKVKSCFLRGASRKSSDHEELFCLVTPDDSRHRVIIVSPEVLFGDDKQKGLVNFLHRDRLKFIAIDEAHLIFEWAVFRGSFSKLASLKTTFDCPIIALTATMKPSVVHRMQFEILRNPVIIKGSMDRPNIKICISSYVLGIAAKGDDKTSDKVWMRLARKIMNIVDGQKTIVYCSFRNECENISKVLSLLGVKSTFYTGNIASADEKIEIYDNLKTGKIDILVATKAFGMGINLPDVRHVIQVGMPENLSLWVQELGRAGRDGQSATATMLICEHLDLKKIRSWTQNLCDQGRLTRKEEFYDVWLFISTAFSGGCLRRHLLQHFQYDFDQLSAIPPQSCCTGCEIKEEIPEKDYNSEILSILQCIETLNSKGIKFVYESQIAAWMAGSEENWMWDLFDLVDLKNESSFGCLSLITKMESATLVKGLLRQCLWLEYLSFEFDVASTSNFVTTKQWHLTENGRRIIQGDKPPYLPEAIKVVQRLLQREVDAVNLVGKKTRALSKKGQDVVSQTVHLMKNENSWIKITEKVQYEMIGFYHDTTKLLYVEDYSTLSCCPVKPNPDYLWKDINLSKGSSFKPLNFGLESDRSENPKFTMLRAHCNGVKVCSGGEEGQACKYAVVKKMSENRCFIHEQAALIPTGVCNFIVYVRPIKEEDKRRWIGFFANGSGQAAHLHPMPCLSKIGSKLKDDIEKALKLDPTKTADDISKGFGIGYNPITLNAAAANKSTLSNLVQKFRIDLTGCGAIATIRGFDKLVKLKVDEEDGKHADNEVDNQKILDMCSPYVRDPRFGDDFSAVLLATPQMLDVLADSLFLEADVTYPGTSAFPYVLNIVAYNLLTMQFQIVSRVLMNKLTASAYKYSFKKVFEVTTNIHPRFNHGSDVKAWIVDFSSAQHTGLSDNIGAAASQVIRGCSVHYQRMAKKVADKVAPRNQSSKDVFLKIAYMIPHLEHQVDVELAFEILQGAEPLQEAKNFMNLTKEERAVNTEKWKIAADWVAWWRKPKIVKMFTKSFKDMTDADWQICPTTTNAVESQNKIGNAKTTLFVAVLENFYRIDKRSCYQTLAAQMGISIGDSSFVRKKKNEQRKMRRIRKKLIVGNQSGEYEADEWGDATVAADDTAEQLENSHTLNVVFQLEGASLQSKSPSRNEGDSQTGANDSAESVNMSSKSSTTTKGPQKKTRKPIDEHINQHVWVNTEGEDGKRFGWCEAIIKKKNRKGNYIAVYVDWPTHFATIPDLNDESEVRLKPIC